MSIYKTGYCVAIILGVFISSSLLAGAGITNPNWYPAPYLLSRLLVVVLSMLGAGTVVSWCYRHIFRNNK